MKEIHARELMRIHIRVKDYENKVHICSIHPDVYNAFVKTCKVHRTFFPRWLTKWTEEDFNWFIDFTEASHIELLNELVVDKYRCVYPHMYYNHVVASDKYWLRVWMSEHMGREVKRHDKTTYNRVFKPTSNCGSRF